MTEQELLDKFEDDLSQIKRDHDKRMEAIRLRKDAAVFFMVFVVVTLMIAPLVVYWCRR